MLQSDGFTREGLQLDLKQEAILGLCLRLTEGSDHSGAGLQEMHTVLCAFVDLWNAFMLMSPDYQVEEGGELTLHETAASGSSISNPFVLVLVKH